MLWLGIWMLGIGRVLFGFKRVITLAGFRWTGTATTLVSKLGGVLVPKLTQGSTSK